MNHRDRIEQTKFFEEQLFEAKRELFLVTTVRQAKFLQSRIKYLRERVKELER